ncbi:amidohydrolase family protein [Pendulispora albinea]|uniref:Amidohydrolase family protein n=1 Tax=Pendulispora albinea TaxID=2741071 RepID=A0ABZ2LYU0_9BACT
MSWNRKNCNSLTFVCAITLLSGACGGGGSQLGHGTVSSGPVVAGPPKAEGAKTTRRVIVSRSQKVGTDVVTVSPDGVVNITLDVHSNGRGPHTDATVHLAPDGTIASLVARGHLDMGTPVAETFERRGNHVRWSSTMESGERDVGSAAFFFPISEIPDALGWLVRSMLESPRGEMALLPAGAARLEKIGVITVKEGAKDRDLVGYSIIGIDSIPMYVWMNPDNSWFGVVSPVWSAVPEGSESLIEPLIEKQNQLERERNLKLMKDVARRPPPGGLAFTHARVLDVENGRWKKDQTVVVLGDSIKSVGPSATTKVPAHAETIDLSGKALLPGLWDMHAHLGPVDGVLNIASGVTTARDVGNDPDVLDDLKSRYDKGLAVGPHVLRFGFIEGRGEKAAPSKVTAENAAEAVAAVETFAKRGYEGIKIYNSVKPELVPVLATAAHARGMMVTGHIPVHMLANEAVRAGYDGVEHINMLFLNFLADHDTETRTTARFTLVGDKAASLDLTSKPVSEFVALLKQRQTVIDPTLDEFEGLLVAEQGKVTPGLEAMVARLPVQVQRAFLLGGLPLDGDKRAKYQASFRALLEMTKLLHDSQVNLVVGTDSLAGLMLHHELALFVRAGISPADALRACTIAAARSMKMEKRMGTIAPGKVADMFVVDGDPLTRIDDVTRIVSVMRAGIVFSSAALYEAIGVAPPL